MGIRILYWNHDWLGNLRGSHVYRPMEKDTMSDKTESELIAGFVKWARANAIPTDTMTDAELYEYVCRYQKAAG